MFISAYVTYLYDLLQMQNPVSEQDIEFVELDHLIQVLTQRSGNPDQLRKLTSCKRSQSQFFCKDAKLLIPAKYKSLVKTFLRDKKITRNFKPVIS
jgi:hypothetical protein